MKHIIVGTAGHIDHGKTALVKALTGIDADRLEEEKRRGITIDLGFAHLQLTPGLRLGFVDVPGHERFVKNMLAGVGGIDLVLFVVAADESIKPQTREHFDICRCWASRAASSRSPRPTWWMPIFSGWCGSKWKRWCKARFWRARPWCRSVRSRAPGWRNCAASWRARRRPSGEKLGRPFPPAHRPRLLGERLRNGGTGTLISGSVAREQTVEVYPRGACCACAEWRCMASPPSAPWPASAPR
jgi:selenocysteine-specific elongation factor